MTKNLLILFLAFIFAENTNAQIDTSFWFASPDISAQMGQAPVVLHIVTYDQASVVYVRQPILVSPSPVSTSISIAANSVYTINLSAYVNSGALESAPTNSVTSKGLYISSKELVSVYYTIGASANKEMVSLKGRSALGRDFYATIPKSSDVMTYSVSDGGMGIDVVATEPGTTIVLFSPKGNCVGRPQNVTFAKYLLQGETFSLLDTSTIAHSELAGTIISSDKDICVSVHGSISTNTLVCPSYFTDQLVPSTLLGTEYVVRRSSGNADITFVIATLNSTSFTVSTASGSFQTLINATESYSISNTDAITYIKSSNPVYLFHLSGFGCKLSGAQLAPAFCAGSYSAAFVHLSSDSLLLNITIRNGYQGNFNLVNGTNTISLPASAFSLVPGTGTVLVSARIFVPNANSSPGSYNLLYNSSDLFALSVINGGTTGGSAYAQASEFRSTSYVQAHVAPTATICANTQFTLNGVVGGGPITGAWSIINGYGTLSGGLTQLTNNIYVPSALDTTNNSSANSLNNQYVKLVLRTTGLCPSITDTLRLHVNQPPIVVAGSNSITCGNIPQIKFSGNVFGATNQGFWTTLAPASGSFVSGANSFTPVYQFSSADTVLTNLKFVLTSTNNGVCAAESKTVTVFINKPPIVNAGPASAVICSNNNTVALNGVVTGTASNSGLWQTSGTGVFTPNNLALNANYIPSGGDLINGTFWLYLRSTNSGLCLPVKDSIQVFVTQPSVVNAGPDINTCSNNARALLAGAITGTTSGTLTWLGGTGTFSPSNSVSTPTYIASSGEIGSGFVTLTLTTINNGLCLASQDVVKVNFQPKPLANFTVGPVCLGQETQYNDRSLNLSSTGLITDWIWNFGDGSPISNNTEPNHVFTKPGLYNTQLVVKNNFDCTDTIVKVAVVNALPSSSFAVARDCDGAAQEITFLDKSTVVGTDIILDDGYYWDFGGFGFSLSQDTAIVFPSDGIYTITHLVTTNTGCQSVYTQTIDVSPRPIARFIYLNNATAGFGALVSFRDTSSNAAKWKWDFGNGTNSEVKNPEVDFKVNGNYTVQLVVSDIYNCMSSYSLEVKISNIVNEIEKLIPNVISPNNDGKNDFWRLDFIDVYFPQADIEIYNRWGEQIFKSKGYSNAWDGSYKGQALPVGAYYYLINLNDGVTPLIKGAITLLK